MDSLLTKLTEKFLFKYKSIPFVLVIAVLSYCKLLSDTFSSSNNQAANTESNEFFSLYNILILSAHFLAVLGYIILCIQKNKLPKAKIDKLTVLFVIDAESNQYFLDVQKKMVSTFKESINDNSVHNFDVLCINKESVNKFNLYNKEDIKKLLKKTRCIFMVVVNHRVDSVTNAENFEMKINYGVVHSKFDDTAMKILQNDMNNLCKPINKRRFRKNQALDVFEFTTHSLTIICKYVVGLVILFSRDYSLAKSIFMSVKSSLRNYNIELLPEGFIAIVDNRLYVACIAIINKNMQDYCFNRDPKLLDEINDKLEELNKVVPNTFYYYLNKAYYCMAKSLDVKKARYCIDKCRVIDKDNEHNVWQYSDALLSVFENCTPITIYKKYEQALKYEHDHLQVVNEVEYYIESEPDRYGLHLAAGLLYDAKGEQILAKRHFTEFLSKCDDRNIKSKIENIIEKYTYTSEDED